MTEEIKAKFEERDKMNKEKKFKAAIQNRQRTEELKEKLWFDIKNIKKGFQPNNTQKKTRKGNRSLQREKQKL